MSGLRLRSRQILVGTSFMQTRQFSYKITHIFSPVRSHMSNDDPKVLNQEKHKKKVKSTIGTAPGWNEKLASESEATVKADRHDKHNLIAVEEMQRQSISLMEEHDYEVEPHEPKGQ